MTQSDKGIQRIVKEWSDHGSAAFDVYLDGARDEYEQARAECGAVTYYTSGRWRYRTIGTMVVRNFPAAVPDDARAAELRMAFMHELIHVAQCAITNPARKVSASNLNGAWIEAVPQAFALGRVGGSWSVGQCARESTVLSTTDRYGYGQWPFWYTLLGPSGGRTYAALLRDVISRPLTKARSSLERALRKHFTTGQLSRALLAWMSAGYFGGTLTSTSGAPIAGGVNNLYNSVQNFVDEETGEPTTTEYSEPLVGRLDPAMGSPASRAVVVPVMGCAALLVSWPDDAQSVSVTASGAPGGDLASVMAVGIDAAPGLDPSAPCTTDGPRTVIALVNGQFTAPRICDRRNGAPVWVLIANGGAAPLKLTVTASAA